MAAALYPVWRPLLDATEIAEPVRKRGIVRQQGIRPPIEKSAGVGEDPHGRIMYEWMRLRNPATGEIPAGIRARELSFARTIPTREFLSKSGQDMLEWTPRGPIRIGGRTRALGIDRRNPNIVNAGGVSGGMWHSTNGGASWTKATRPDQHHSVTTLIQDPRPGQEDIWYYGSGEFIGNSANAPGGPYLGTGLYRSTDNGATWELFGFEPAGESPVFDRAYDVFFNLAIDPTNTSQLEFYAATYGLIYRFDGVTREPLLIDDPNSPTFSSFSDVAVTDGGVVYAALSSDGGMGGLWQSPDGDEWTEITPAGWPSVFQRVVIGIAPSDQNIVYFLGHTPGTGPSDHSLWRYNALDDSWEDRTANLPTAEQFSVPSNFPEDLGAFDSQNGYDLVIAVKPDDPNVVFIGGTNLYRSTDGFATPDNTHWIAGYHPTLFVYPNHHPDMHAIAFDPTDPNRMYTGSDGGVHRTDDALAINTQRTPVSWTPLNDGYRTTQFYTVALDESEPGDHVIVGGMQDNGTVYTNESTGTLPWIGDILGGDGAYADIADGREHFYVSAQNAQIFRLRIDDAGNVTQAARVDPTEDEFGRGLFVTPFHLDPNNQRRMYLGGGSALYRNSNLLAIEDGSMEETDQNWTRLENTDTNGGVVTAVTPVAVSATSTRVYYATLHSGTSQSRIFRLEDAHIGQPSPVDITQRTGPDAMPEGAYISSIAVDPEDPDRLLITFSNYEVRSLFYSEDAGETWTDVSGNLEDNPDGSGSGPSTRWAEILPVSGGTIYFVGTSTGLYSTIELAGDSTEWVQEGASTIGNVVVDMIDSRPVDYTVVVATHGNGIYSTIADLDLTQVEPLDPGEVYVLSEPFPNPFQSTAQVAFRVAHEQDVSARLYDAMGREVDRLFEGRVQPDEGYTIIIPAGTLANGVYRYLVEGEHFSASGSVVLLR